jgi:serine/threonine-protein kinase
VPNPVPGTLLGAYRVEANIGSGSMGDVFRGIDTGLNRRVAIKILSEKHRDSPELRARFIREGRAVAAISHPHVVQVFATGTFDERPYIAMEFLEGTDLGAAVEKRGPLSSVEAAHAILDAAQGLAAASRAGLIHRDVKPSNLVRLQDGTVKVTDFGLAKPVDPGSEPALTAMGVVVGTPDYIAPEQARGEPIDERVDIYALGGSLYYLLTGIPPFRTGRPADDKYLKVVARHLRNPPPDAAVARPGVDREMAELVKRMMSKKAAERPTYAELIQLVTGILARLDPAAVPDIVVSTRERSRPIIIPSGLGASLTDPSPADASVALPVRRGLPAWLVVITLASIALFAAGLIVYLQHGAGATPTTSPGGSASPGSGSAGTGSGARGALDPVPPAGMILVRKRDGSPWFFVDEKPVSAGDFQKLFADHVQATGPDDPVTSISYDRARSYAQTRGGRLLRADEWDRATTTPGVVVSDGLYEWVESPEGSREVRQHGKSQVRPDKEQKDVTFRMAKDL